MYWNKEQKQVSLKFDENTDTEIDVKCPICNSPIIKNKYGYRCIRNKKDSKECDFYLGEIAGVLVDETNFKKIMLGKKSDLIQGFKSKEKGKFSAYLLWDESKKKIVFEFPSNSPETSKI